MEDKKKQQLLLKYRMARNEYRTIAINQLSFANNLLLTLAVGFMTLGVDKEDFKTLSFRYGGQFSFEKLLLILFVGSMVVSIVWGVLVMFSRLYDFRLTRHILTIRVRILEKINGEKLSYDILQPTFRKDRWSSFWISWRDKIDKFTQANIDNFESNKANLEKRFETLRKIAQDLGDASIKWTRCQSCWLLIGVFFFLLHLLLL